MVWPVAGEARDHQHEPEEDDALAVGQDEVSDALHDPILTRGASLASR